MKLFKYTKVLIFLTFISNLLYSDCSENTNKNNNSNLNLSQENSKLNGGIYLNESMEKHRKARFTAEYSSKNRNSNLNKAASKKNVMLNKETNIPQGGFSPAGLQKSESQKPVVLQKSGPIVHQGWVKYFKYTNEALSVLTPKQFITNTGFYEQKKFFPKDDFTKTNDEGVHEFIKNENYFYFTIFPGYFVFNQSKKVIIRLIIFYFS